MKYLTIDEMHTQVVRHNKCKQCREFRRPFWYAGEPMFFNSRDDYIIHWNLKHRFKSKHKGDIVVVDVKGNVGRIKPTE